MDRNSIIGLSVLAILFAGYIYVSQPSDSELALQQKMSDSLELLNKNQEKLAEEKRAKDLKLKDSLDMAMMSDSSAMAARFGGYAAQVKGTEKTNVLENKNIKITLSNRGAGVLQAELKNFKTDARKQVLLLDEKYKSNRLAYIENGKPIASDDYYWIAEQKGDKQVSYKLYNSPTDYVEVKYTLSDTGFNLDEEIRFNRVKVKDAVLNWQSDINLQERDIAEESKKTTVYYKYKDEKADYISETEFESKKLENEAQWVSLKQQFFNTTIMAEKNFKKETEVLTQQPTSGTNVKSLGAKLILPEPDGAEQLVKLKYYFGPNKYSLLKEQNVDLDQIIPLGVSIFRWINKLMIIPIFNFLQTFLSNYGIIILLLTLIIKTILLPLVFKSYKSTAKMRVLKPEIDELKEKFKDNMQQFQLEQMALYKKAGVNMFGGCLPMLLQMPILIAVFQFVPSAFEFRQQAFLWADDLSIYDSIWNFGKIPVIESIYGDHVSLFTLLMTISTLIYTKMNNELTSGMNDQMKYISYIMPIMFLGFFNRYASALTYYYFLSNMVTFTQQFVIRRLVDEDKLKAQIAESRSRSTNDKSAFQTRLEEMAKAQANKGKKK